MYETERFAELQSSATKASLELLKMEQDSCYKHVFPVVDDTA